MRTDVIWAIDPARESTWQGKVFLVVDLDWATDEVLHHAISLLETYKVKCTLFATHDSEGVSGLKNHENFEIGIHPNYNDLLSRTAAIDSASILAFLHAKFPSARSIRSHSLLQSSRLQNE